MNGKSVVAEWSSRYSWRAAFVCALTLSVSASSGRAQEQPAVDSSIEARIQKLTDAMNRVEGQMQESQRELAELKQQLSALRGTPETAAPAETSGAAELAEAVAGLRESQSMSESQIATLQQTKVETASKYPLKLSGIVLMTSFANTGSVDMPATPVIALNGPGSTGATFQQSILGVDIHGPHVLGARSHADLRFDFDGGPVATQSGNGSPQFRLRTAHADLKWNHTRLLFALDRPVLTPETPTSLIAVAEPELAWSGNLWTWNPQFGVSRDLIATPSGDLEIQASLIDVGDPPSLYTSQSNTYATPGTAELSRWPGIEGRIGYQSTGEDHGIRFGASGLFSPHRIPSLSTRFNSWAGAIDFALPISPYTRISGNVYSGAGLGGLGGGAFKDYVWRSVYGETYFRVLDDRGGWLQGKQRAGERLEFNETFGIDTVPAHQLRPYATSTSANYYNLARNRTFSGNIIYSPNASLLFSLEYRRIASSYVTSSTWSSNVIGLGAGYKF